MTRTFTASPRFGFGFQTEFCDDACGQSDKSVIAIVNRGSVTRIAFFILVESRRGELLLHPVTKGTAKLRPVPAFCTVRWLWSAHRSSERGRRGWSEIRHSPATKHSAQSVFRLRECVLSRPRSLRCS